jgi:hypothetical protein
MIWMLIAVIEGEPIKTNLTYDSLSACLAADEQVRAEHAKEFNVWMTWAAQNPSESAYPDSQAFMQKRIGLDTYYTCIPHNVEDEGTP